MNVTGCLDGKGVTFCGNCGGRNGVRCYSVILGSKSVRRDLEELGIDMMNLITLIFKKYNWACKQIGPLRVI